MASILRQNDKIYRNGLSFTFRHFRFCVSGQKHQSALPASIRWTAPEILQHPNAEEGRGSVFTGACDVYSFGMLMWEMTTGLDPYEGIKDESKVSWILNTWYHYNDVIMGTMASQITSVYSTVYSGADQRKHQSSTSLAFVWGIHRDRWIPRTNGQ